MTKLVGLNFARTQARRMELNLSYEQVAKLMGLTGNASGLTKARYFKENSSRVRIDTVIRLAKALRCDPNYLLKSGFIPESKKNNLETFLYAAVYGTPMGILAAYMILSALDKNDFGIYISLTGLVTLMLLLVFGELKFHQGKREAYKTYSTILSRRLDGR